MIDETERSKLKAPTQTTRYSIPYFLAVRYDLTLDQLKGSAADISRRIPLSDTPEIDTNQVASEFLSPSFSCVRQAQQPLIDLIRFH
jgi:isopenicillin N synthase-like dioxygenase